MKNNKIIDSWNKIEPSDSANERMLDAILEYNRSVNGGIEATDKINAPDVRKKTWLKFGAAAAALAVLLAAAIPALIRQNDGVNPVLEENVSGEDVSKNGIYIPAIERAASDGGSNEMIPMVIYRGGVYTESTEYHGEEIEKFKGLLGEHLGRATGNIDLCVRYDEYEKSIDDWLAEDGSSRKFVSTISGEVYAVNGYDTSFRVCVLEDIGPYRNMYFLDKLNGITISTGKDLFEDRLHLKGRVASIQWQSHYDWNYTKGNYQDASFDLSVWDMFLDAADEAEFINTFLPYDRSFYKSHPYSHFFSTPNQAHLALIMDDGTVVKIRLIADGYVGYDAIGWWYYVKIPEEIFNAVYDACGGAHVAGW